MLELRQGAMLELRQGAMLELRILTGLHRGAALPLDGEAIHIGSSGENDIVLLDPGMPARAGVLVRSGEAAWQFRPRAVAHERGASSAADATAVIAVTSGSRWFAGPVLIGCDEESAPWCSAAMIASAQRSARLGPRFRTKAVAVVLAAALAGIAALLAVRPVDDRPRAVEERPAPASASAPASNAAGVRIEQPAGEHHDALEPPVAAPAGEQSVRIVKGAVYPDEIIKRPPFSIRSASSGPYGFIVTDDGHILMPGSRWRSFTLERIEPTRAVFTGPHAAELTW